MASTPKPLRKAIAKKVTETRKDIQSASKKRFPTEESKKKAIKRYEKHDTESVKHSAKQGYISRKGKELMGEGRAGKVNATKKGGFNKNRGTNQTKMKMR